VSHSTGSDSAPPFGIRNFRDLSSTVSIIIPTKDCGPALKRCMEGIRRQVHGFELELIVVDSGSKDNTLEIAKSYGARTVTVDKFTNDGVRNLGASLAKGDYLVFCNSDAVPADENWLVGLIAALAGKRVGASYSRQIAKPDAPLLERILLQRIYPPESRVKAIEALACRGPLDMVLFSTVSGAMRRDVWKRFRFRLWFSEDQEIACRMVLSGYKIAYCADSIVNHSHSYPPLDAFRRCFNSGWSLACLPLLRANDIAKSIDCLLGLCRAVLQHRPTGFRERAKGLSCLFAKILGFGLGQLAPRMPGALCSRLVYRQ